MTEPTKKKSSSKYSNPDWRKADDEAIAMSISRDNALPFRDEDEMIEYRREMRQELYYDRMERRDIGRFY